MQTLQEFNEMTTQVKAVADHIAEGYFILAEIYEGRADEYEKRLHRKRCRRVLVLKSWTLGLTYGERWRLRRD